VRQGKLVALAFAALTIPAFLSAQEGNLPLKYTAKPTQPAITAGDLMSRLYIFADDSMMGRQFGTEGNLKGTEYIANEVRKMGLKPGGDRRLLPVRAGVQGFIRSALAADDRRKCPGVRH
jgi:hypothetical protein